MGILPIHRVATAMPFIHYLQQQGINLKHELRLAKLPVLAMHDKNSFIPSRNYWNLIGNVASREGFEDIGFIVGQQSGANAAGPGLAQQLLSTHIAYIIKPVSARSIWLIISFSGMGLWR